MKYAWVLGLLLGCAAAKANHRYDWIQRCIYKTKLSERECEQVYDEDPEGIRRAERRDQGLDFVDMWMGAGSGCCVTCSKGQPCGNSCISWAKTCHQPPGCAC